MNWRIRSDPDSLLTLPMREQLKALRGLLAGRGPSDLVPWDQGVANVQALGGFSVSLRRGRPYSLKDCAPYLRSVASFRKKT